MARFVWPCRASQCAKFSSPSCGTPRRNAIIPRLMASLSASESADAERKETELCSGAGRKPGCSTLCLPPGSRNRDAIEPADFLFNTELPVKADQIRAAAEKNVLAVVDNFARAGMLIGRRPAANVGPALDQVNAIAGVRQGTGGRQSRQTAADNCDLANAFAVHGVRFELWHGCQRLIPSPNAQPECHP